MRKKTLATLVICLMLTWVAGPLRTAHAGEITLDVTGMTCRICPKAVKKALKMVEGVEEVEVSYKEKTARVVYDAGKTGVKELVESVKKAGYGASVRPEPLR